MPLVQSILVIDLQKIIDDEYIDFEGFPKDSQENAARWATAVNNYASEVIPPSTTSTSAKLAFEALMLTIDPNLGNGFIVLQQSFNAYAAQLAIGMLPAFTGTPPPVPINFDSIGPLGLAGAPAETIANMMGIIIDTWFRTGIAVPTVPGPAQPWA